MQQFYLPTYLPSLIPAANIDSIENFNVCVLGLIIKKILAMAQHDSHARRLLKRTSGIVFYSVPHRGAPLAAYGKHTKYIFYPSVEVQELNQGLLYCQHSLWLVKSFQFRNQIS